MKHILLLAAALAVATAGYGQQKAERWKERARLDLKKKEVPYRDTIYLQKQDGAINLRKGGFLYKGKRAGKVLDMGYATFGIVKEKDDELQLRDDEYIHIFTPEPDDLSAADAPAPGRELPDSPVASIDTALLKGSWEAYKRSSRSGPLGKVDYKTLVKTLAYSSQKNEAYYYGSISTNYTGGNTLCSITGTRGAHIVAEDDKKKQYLFKVWKLSKDEMIIEDEQEILYFMKHFN